MRELKQLPNIGATLEVKLKKVGIATAEDLVAVGSKEAWIRVKAIDSNTSLNTLYALEGAIEGVRWPNLSDYVLNNLMDFYKSKVALRFN